MRRTGLLWTAALALTVWAAAYLVGADSPAPTEPVAVAPSPVDAPRAEPVAPVALAEQPAPVAAPSAEPEAVPATPGTAGLVVALDPETGELGMASAAQRAALGLDTDLSLNYSSVGLVEVHHPDGHVSVDLQGRFQEYSVARVGADGKFHYGCVHHADELERALSAPAPALEEE